VGGFEASAGFSRRTFGEGGKSDFAGLFFSFLILIFFLIFYFAGQIFLL